MIPFIQALMNVRAYFCNLKIRQLYLDFNSAINGRAYANAANNITRLNPNSTATIVARAVLITDTHPLSPHAQGICSTFSFETCDSPAGKGIPIKNANGAINRKTINNL